MLTVLPALTAYSDAGVFNAIAITVFARYSQWFQFETAIGSFDVGPPILTFLGGPQGHDLSLSVSARLRLGETVMNLKVTLYADVRVRRQVVQIHRILVVAETGSTLFNALLNATLG